MRCFGSAFRRRRRARGSSLLALAAAALVAAAGGAAQAAVLHLRCTNPASGTSWPIVVDLDHKQVDSFPAEISDRWISWRDPDHRIFELERATGKLEMRNASSTGGYFLHYLCRLEQH